MVKPDSRATHVAHMRESGERAHYSFAAGIIVQLTFGILDAVDVLLGELDAVLGCFPNAEVLMLVLGLHLDSVVKLPIGFALVFPGLFEVV